MQRSKNVIFNICFALNCMLVFFLVFENRLVLPAWVQVIGRMHPLLLHLPITLLLLYIFWALFVEKKTKKYWQLVIVAVRIYCCINCIDGLIAF